jgi:hypothetical protein
MTETSRPTGTSAHAAKDKTGAENLARSKAKSNAVSLATTSALDQRQAKQQGAAQWTQVHLACTA